MWVVSAKDGCTALHALDEELHRVAGQQVAQVRSVASASGQRQRRHAQHRLAGDAERLAAGGEDAQVRTRRAAAC